MKLSKYLVLHARINESDRKEEVTGLGGESIADFETILTTKCR